MAAAADGTAKGHDRPSLATAGQPMRELFIYYRSRVECAAEVAALVRGFQAQLRLEHPALVARLLRRPESKDGLLTWMETYAFATMNPDHAIDAIRRCRPASTAGSGRGEPKTVV